MFPEGNIIFFVNMSSCFLRYLTALHWRNQKFQACLLIQLLYCQISQGIDFKKVLQKVLSIRSRQVNFPPGQTTIHSHSLAQGASAKAICLPTNKKKPKAWPGQAKCENCLSKGQARIEGVLCSPWINTYMIIIIFTSNSFCNRHSLLVMLMLKVQSRLMSVSII